MNSLRRFCAPFDARSLVLESGENRRSSGATIEVTTRVASVDALDYASRRRVIVVVGTCLVDNTTTIEGGSRMLDVIDRTTRRRATTAGRES